MIKGCFKWNSGCKMVKNNNRVIISNACRWIEISNECFELIENAIKNNENMEDFVQSFENFEDQKYIEVLIEKLESFDALISVNVKDERDIGVYLVVTNRCNLKCIHCCVNANEKHINKDILSTKEIFQTIDKLIYLDPTSITITGGEPLIRQDIFDILKYLRTNYSGEIFMMTNGLLINEHNIDNIILCVDHIDISIDGIDEDTCSKVRGKGVFSKVLNAVKLLQKHNFTKISLLMVFGLSNDNLRQDFEELNKKYNTKPIARFFTPIGRGDINKDFYIQGNVNSMLEMIPQKSIAEQRKELYVGECGAIQNSLTIDYTGFIYPCSLLLKEKYILGDIRKIKNLREWYEKRKFSEVGYQNFLNLIPSISPKCKNCNINIFCWDCLEVMDRLSENLEKWNKRCEMQKALLTPIIWS